MMFIIRPFRTVVVSLFAVLIGLLLLVQSNNEGLRVWGYILLVCGLLFAVGGFRWIGRWFVAFFR